jgi:hypothetical protein
MSERKCPLLTEHFRLNETPEAIAEIARDVSEHSNVYFGPYIVRRGLTEYQRGAEADIRAVLALVLEADEDGGKPLNLPRNMPAETLIVRTSHDPEAGTANKHHHWIFEEPASVKDAKRLRSLAARVCGGDANVNKDVVHVFRLPGTWNRPGSKKINRGRSPEPQDVELIGGSFKPVSFEKLMDALEAAAEKMGVEKERPAATAKPAKWVKGGLDDADEITEALLGYSQYHEIVEWLDEEGDDRSAHSHKVMQALMERGRTDDEILTLAEGSHFADKFVDRGDIKKEISRERAKWVENGEKALHSLESYGDEEDVEDAPKWREWRGTGEEFGPDVIDALRGYPHFLEVKKLIATDGGSAHCRKVVRALLERERTEGEILALAECEDALFARRFGELGNHFKWTAASRKVEKLIKEGRKKWIADGKPVLPRFEAVEDEEDGNSLFDPLDDENGLSSLVTVDPYEVSGVIARIRDWTVDTAPIKPDSRMALAAALATVSILSSRHLCTETDSRLTLYLAIVADATSGKNWPLSIPGRILSELGLQRVISSASTSAPALEERLVECPLTQLVIDEICSLLSRMSGKNASSHEQDISALLRELWSLVADRDRPTTFALKREQKTQKRPHLGILGASTGESFYRALGAGAVKNGLFSRLTVIGSDESPSDRGILIDRPALRLPDDIRDSLLAIWTSEFGTDPSKVTWPHMPDRVLLSERARNAYNDFNHRLTGLLKDTGFSEYFGRIAEQGMRLATLHALGRVGRDAFVNEKDMLWGLAFSVECAKTAYRGLTKYQANSEWQKNVRLVEDIFNRLGALNGGVVTRSQLCKALDSRIPIRQLNEIIDSLIEKAFLKRPMNKAAHKGGRKGGRPPVQYVVASLVK